VHDTRTGHTRHTPHDTPHTAKENKKEIVLENGNDLRCAERGEMDKEEREGSVVLTDGAADEGEGFDADEEPLVQTPITWSAVPFRLFAHLFPHQHSWLTQQQVKPCTHYFHCHLFHIFHNSYF
jgi:hypothetical protein